MKLDREKLETRLAHGPLGRLTRVACVLALIGLAMMVFSILVPRPLPVVLAMSVGQAFGGAAVLCYMLAILVEAARTSRLRKGSTSLPPPSQRGK